MSMEPQPRPETPRTGKYCPRCHAMAPRDQAQCRQCGHQFRTGPAPDSGTAQSAAPDPLHRTMQFVLPPLSAHAAAPEPLPLFRRSQQALRTPRRAQAAGVAAAALVCVAAGAGWLAWKHFLPARPTPVGVWETTLHGKAAANAHLEFAFQAGGAGRFSWRESGPTALSGQTPLRWKQNPDGKLALALTPPSGEDPLSQALAGIWSSHAWTWHVEQSPRRLVLGTLVFTEKP